MTCFNATESDFQNFRTLSEFQDISEYFLKLQEFQDRAQAWNGGEYWWTVPQIISVQYNYFVLEHLLFVWSFASNNRDGEQFNPMHQTVRACSAAATPLRPRPLQVATCRPFPFRRYGWYSVTVLVGLVTLTFDLFDLGTGAQCHQWHGQPFRQFRACYVLPFST